MDCSPPGSSVHGIFQARILEWVAIFPFQRRKWVCISLYIGYIINVWHERKHVKSYREANRIFLSASAGTMMIDILFSSVAQSCPTLCDPMNRSTPGLPVHHKLPEFTQTHMHRVSNAIQPSHPLLSPFPSTPNHSQHQSLFQWVNSSHELAKVLEFQL